jgi:hypothetical protein
MDRVFRTSEPPPPTDPDVDDGPKVVIYLPDPPSDEMDMVKAGNIDIEGGPAGGISFIDPTGSEWNDESADRVVEVFRQFLLSEDEWLQLTSPMNGTPIYLNRVVVGRAWCIQASRVMIRKDLKPMAVPSGLDVRRGVPPDFLRHGRRPG